MMDSLNLCRCIDVRWIIPRNAVSLLQRITYTEQEKANIAPIKKSPLSPLAFLSLHTVCHHFTLISSISFRAKKNLS